MALRLVKMELADLLRTRGRRCLLRELLRRSIARLAAEAGCQRQLEIVAYTSGNLVENGHVSGVWIVVRLFESAWPELHRRR